MLARGGDLPFIFSVIHGIQGCSSPLIIIIISLKRFYHTFVSNILTCILWMFYSLLYNNAYQQYCKMILISIVKQCYLFSVLIQLNVNFPNPCMPSVYNTVCDKNAMLNGYGSCMLVWQNECYNIFVSGALFYPFSFA